MLGKRLARLEAKRPALGVSPPLDLIGLAPDVVARVMQAKGTRHLSAKPLRC